MGDGRTKGPEAATVQQEKPKGRPCIVVVADGIAATHLLPAHGDVHIGRSPECEIQVDHASISRRHAVLHVGETLTIEDLGSANGTSLRDELLEPNRPAELSFGEIADLGSIMIIVQRTARTAETAPSRRIWTHGYFELRLEDECERAARTGKEFGLLRIHSIPPSDRNAAQELSNLLRPEDVIGAYGPGELEVILVDQSTEAVDGFAEKLPETLAERGAPVRVGVACFPRDGTSPHALLARANSGTRQSPPIDAAPGEVVADGAMQKLHRLVEKVAAGKISVLILGETGVGKEVLAKTVHRLSPRADKPFVALNCAAFSETLLESELFGHEKGAFTGADQAKPGLLETAEGGTVFLDEVGELPTSVQVKLLRVLEEREVLRVGGLKPRPIDVRFVAATHRDLEAQVDAGAFREDLMYRLNGVVLVVPPLRERLAEIEPLAEAFAAEAAAELGRGEIPKLSAEAAELLRGYIWPGNIRELRNVVERAVLLADDIIEPEHLPTEKIQAAVDSLSAGSSATDSVPTEAGDGQRQRIVDALEQCAGNQTRAAKLLGVSRRTLSTWLNKYDIPRPIKGEGD